MAKMIGKTLRFRQCPYECCGLEKNRHTVKREEEVLWRKEADEEMAHGMFCGDYYCPECSGEDFDYYDASELDGIKGCLD